MIAGGAAAWLRRGGGRRAAAIRLFVSQRGAAVGRPGTHIPLHVSDCPAALQKSYSDASEAAARCSAGRALSVPKPRAGHRSLGSALARYPLGARQTTSRAAPNRHIALSPSARRSQSRASLAPQRARTNQDNNSQSAALEREALRRGLDRAESADDGRVT